MTSARTPSLPEASRSSLAGLWSSHPIPQPIQVAGRVVMSEGDQAVLRDASGIALLVGSPLPKLHSLVRLEVHWDGRAMTLVRILEEHTPAEFGALTESELWALTSRDELKYRCLMQRTEIMRMIRGFFDGRAFLEVETPLVVPSPGLDVHLDALSVSTSQGTRYLVTSPEYQMKRLLAGGLERIYQISKCFRNDETGVRHQPEFTMLEWYRAFAGVEDVMRDTEELVADLTRAVHHSAELPTPLGPVNVTPPWRRLTMREAFAQFCDVSMDEALADEEQFFRLLIDRIEPRLAELGAVFLCEWPASMASLARKKPGDPSVAERFEAYIAGVELCNGFGELTDVHEQRARLLADQATRRELGLPVYPLDERFLSALAQGIPPSGGNALGLDRLIMLLAGAEHIEDVLAIGASRL